MRDIRSRLEQLEAKAPAVTLQSSTADLCRYLARLNPQELRAALREFDESRLAELVEEIGQHVPGYGLGEPA